MYPNTLSALFIFAFIIYITLAFYLYFFEAKNEINKIFSITLVLMSIWALAYAYAANAPTFELALLMKKIASLAWVNVFAFYLHTFVLLARVKKDKVPMTDIFLLYSTPISLTLIIHFYKPVSDIYFNIQNTKYGWQNFRAVPLINIWMSAYIVIYAFTGVILLYNWKRKTKIIREIKQATLMSYGIIFTMQFGFYTDMVGPLILNKTFPEIGVITSIIPMFITWYAIVKFKISPVSIDDLSDEIIANMNEGLIVINELGLISHVNINTSNILNLESTFLKGRHINDIISESESFFESYFNAKNLNNGTNLVFSPNFDQNIIGSNNKIVPTTLSVASMYDDWDDFVGGCIIFSDMTEIKTVQSELKKAHEYLEDKIAQRTAELNNNNIKILSELSHKEFKNHWNRLLSRISSSFVKINESNIDIKMNKMLENIAKFFGLNAAQIYILCDEHKYVVPVYQWIDSHLDHQLFSANKIEISKYEWTLKNILTGPIVISDVNEMPKEASYEKEGLKALSINSSLAIPLTNNNEFIGLCRFDTCVKNTKWTDDTVKMITFLTNMVVDGIVKVNGEKKITQLAYYDILTGLPNRVKIIDTIDNLIRKPNNYIALVLLDFDSFKNIADSLGFDAGDEYIKIIANELYGIVGNYEYVCRFDDDEFLVVLNSVRSKDDIIKKVVEIYNLFQKQYVIKDQIISVTASIGISQYPTDGYTTNELIKNADITMNKAKNTGKNKYLICSDQLRNEINRYTVLTNDLYTALERQELYIEYQPQIELSTRKIVGVEALLRWRHPKLGLISPSEFIPIAESTGLIIKIGNWVLNNALMQAKEWQLKYSAMITVAVNLSLAQFLIGDFATDVINILEKHSFNPNFLENE